MTLRNKVPGSARFAIAALIVMTVVSGFSGCAKEKTIKLGFNAQMTGPDSYIGQAAKLALEDRIKEVNDKGGIQGYKIQLITYDSRSEAADAIAATKRLL